MLLFFWVKMLCYRLFIYLKRCYIVLKCMCPFCLCPLVVLGTYAKILTCLPICSCGLHEAPFGGVWEVYDRGSKPPPGNRVPEHWDSVSVAIDASEKSLKCLTEMWFGHCACVCTLHTSHVSCFLFTYMFIWAAALISIFSLFCRYIIEFV